MKVIGSGLGRTGTYTLKFALEELGFGKCYHMLELFQNPSGVEYFRQAEKGFSVNWNELFNGYSSAVDYPVARYFRQLADYYPEAKIVHTLRDPEEWFHSATETIFMVNQMPLKIFMRFGIRFPFRKEIRRRFPVLRYNRMLMRKEFGNNVRDKAEVIRRFEQHTENVINHFPSSRLLVFDTKQGWDPLCKFFNVAVPNAPFPHFNKRKDFLSKVETIGMGRFLSENEL